MKPVIFLKSARDDLRSEKKHYREIEPKLAVRLQVAVEHTVQSISHRPLAMEAKDFDIRRWPASGGFPHGVLYRVDQNQVIVLSIFHPKRDPETWKVRVRT